MSINTISGSSFTSGVVIGDNASNDYPVTLTPKNGVGVDAVLELQSKSGALLLPRMTSDQINAISVPCNGMIAYYSDLNSIALRESNTWDGQSGIGSVFSYSYSYIDHNEITGMYENPREIIGAPGAGFCIRPLKAILYYKNDATDYTGGGNIQFQYGSTPHAGGANAFSSIINSTLFTANVRSIASVYQSESVMPSQENVGLYLSNAAAKFNDGGLTASVVYAFVWYRIESI